jgi:hypothetical protein
MYEAYIVPFYENDLITTEVNGEYYVAMKPIVKGMGLDWRSQQVKFRASQRYYPQILPIKTKGGIQKMLCLPESELNMWYHFINPERRKVSTETEYRDSFVSHLIIRGWTVETEKKTPLGRADIYATSGKSILVMECKIKSCNAVTALGQLLFYKQTYPKAQLIFACKQLVNSEKESIFREYGISVVSSVNEISKRLGENPLYVIEES